ncbi:MAG: hypothetical protein U0935_07865 [Pirellulales bacterium]
MKSYDATCDDYYVNLNLHTEMELPQSRESILHFFEQLQKHYPQMRNFYTRERGEFVLEEEKDKPAYRWASIEPRRVCSGAVNPTNVAAALQQHSRVLELVPYALSVSPLDCESLNVMFGFDFFYRGNHSQLLAEALGLCPAFERLAELPGSTVLSYEPALQLALEADCRTQVRLSFETRTSAYHVRSGEFPEEQLSVYLTARRYGSLEPGDTYVASLERLAQTCCEIVDNYLIEHVLNPLRHTIALK